MSGIEALVVRLMLNWGFDGVAVAKDEVLNAE
jgi:hypothetical protein